MTWPRVDCLYNWCPEQRPECEKCITIRAIMNTIQVCSLTGLACDCGKENDIEPCRDTSSMDLFGSSEMFPILEEDFGSDTNS